MKWPNKLGQLSMVSLFYLRPTLEDNKYKYSSLLGLVVSDNAFVKFMKIFFSLPLTMGPNNLGV